MKKILYIIILILCFTTSVFSNESNHALLEMQDNMKIAFHNVSDELSNFVTAEANNKLYHDETVFNLTPELGVKVPGLVGLSFTVGVEYTFKRKLPAGYAYDKP